MTALRGRNMSEDSLAASTSILAAPYVVLHFDSLCDSGSSLPTSEGSQGEERIDKAIELDTAARAPGFLALEWALTTFGLTKLAGVGVVEEGFLRKGIMAGSRTKTCQDPACASRGAAECPRWHSLEVGPKLELRVLSRSVVRVIELSLTRVT